MCPTSPLEKQLGNERNKRMNKVIMFFTVLVMFGIVGCGSGLEKEYEAIRREFWTVIAKGKDPGKAVVEADMKKFREASPEQQKKLIESAKEDLKVIKSVK